MKRPAFQFYPADWRKDVELRSCSISARGLWVDLLCVMHECDPYGHLILNGKPMTAGQIAGQIGLTGAQVKKLLDELLTNGVARTNDQGVIFSKRMVNDERIRNARAEGGKSGAEHGSKGAEYGSKGGRPKEQKGGLETPLDDGSKPPPSSSSSSSSSTSKEVNTAPETLTGIPPGDSESAGCSPGEISKAMRSAGVMAQPADPRIIALSDQGVTVETVTSACEEAKRSKPNESIGPGYVFKILERWAKDAADIKAQGAKPPEKREDMSWKASNEGIDRKAREIGMYARGGESYRDFASRIEDEIRKRKEGKAA